MFELEMSILAGEEVMARPGTDTEWSCNVTGSILRGAESAGVPGGE